MTESCMVHETDYQLEEIPREAEQLMTRDEIEHAKPISCDGITSRKGVPWSRISRVGRGVLLLLSVAHESERTQHVCVSGTTAAYEASET